jgi:penicillin amidase
MLLFFSPPEGRYSAMSYPEWASTPIQTGATRKPKRGAGHIALRIALYGLLAILLLAGLTVGGGYWFVQRTLPQTSGSLQVKGLASAVSVVRDHYGVPHITGASVHDVVFAQGYVTAQDRLFQMEFNRSVAQGRLAQLFSAGPDRSLVDADEFLRTLDLYSSARTELQNLDPNVRDELKAYADGVNAFISTHKNSLPLEFTILGVTPDPWQPVDSLAYGRVVAYSLDGTWNTKLARAAVVAKLGPDAMNTLFPAYPSDSPTLIPTTHFGTMRLRGAGAASANSLSAQAAMTSSMATGSVSASLLRGAAVVRSLLGDVQDGLGSNDWVVSGGKTATGKPLLANDPHLGINMPSIWYEVALRGGGLDVIGFSFPGDPGVVIGHNDYIAWGVTNVDADNTDLYIEKLDPQGHPGKYLYDREWLPLQTRQETINIRGEATPVTITVTSTVHGPLLNDVVSDLKNQAPVALHWTALQPEYSFQGFFQLDFARNWQEFNDAIDKIAISQNFVYADTDGNIGYRMSGLLPLRGAANRTLPVGGITSAYDWTGYVPQSSMPRLFNPPQGYIATANNQIVDYANPVYVTTDWDYGYRAARITTLLQQSSQVTVADYQRIQNDVYSIPASKLAPLFVAAGQSAGGDAAQAAKMLSAWDFTMSKDSAAAAIYEATAGALARGVIEPALGADVYRTYRGNFSASGLYTVLINLLTSPTPPFLADKNAANAAIVAALGSAMSELRSRLGSDASTWRWGALHQAHFAHPLASVQPLNLLFDVAPVARPGDSTTVNAAGGGGFSADPASNPNHQVDYSQHTVPSMRQIIDLSNFDASLWVTTTGESGQPGSAHYSDLVPLWNTGRYQPMTYSAAAVAKSADVVLTLQP